MSRRLLAGIPLGLCLALAGCITTPLESRDWIQIQTAHYEIWSSLGDDSAQIAVELERFRAGTEFIWGRAIAAEPVRTRVYAFDDRAIGRPFAYHSQRSYLLARQRGDVIVLRTGGGWEGDAWTPFKLVYARRLVSNASAAAPPPWLEEGLAQVASTVEIRGDGATIGMLRIDHIRTLRESKWVPFGRLLAATDLRGWSSLERALFEAESWALCHYLAFSAERRDRSGAEIARFRALLGEGKPPAEAARAAFGDERDLQRAVWEHVRAAKLPSLSVRIPWAGPKPATRAVSKREILEQLGLLAVAIDERGEANRFLEGALELDAGSPRALAGLGDMLAVEGDRDAAEVRYEAALAAAPDDPFLHLGRANLLRARAADAVDPAQRAQLSIRAREHYERSIALDARIPEPHAGLAASYLLDGEDPAAGRAPARAARKLLPGDAEIALLGARLALAVGDREGARREAIDLMTRARSASDLDTARALLERIDSQAAIR